MKHAIISLGGKQFNIQENGLIEVPGNTSLEPVVLFYNDGKISHVGAPSLKDFHIKLDLVEQKRGEKVSVKRFKAKSRYKKNHGHRQDVMVLRVTELGEAKKTEKAQKEEVTEKPSVKKTTSKPVKKALKAEK